MGTDRTRESELDCLMADLLDVIELDEGVDKPVLATVWRSRLRNHITRYRQYYRDLQAASGKQERLPST